MQGHKRTVRIKVDFETAAVAFELDDRIYFCRWVHDSLEPIKLGGKFARRYACRHGGCSTGVEKIELIYGSPNGFVQ